MITTADLKTQTRRELADLARDQGVSGWHGMKKDELIDAISKLQRNVRRKSGGTERAAAKAAAATTAARKAPAAKTPAAKAPAAKSPVVKVKQDAKPAAAKSPRAKAAADQPVAAKSAPAAKPSPVAATAVSAKQSPAKQSPAKQSPPKQAPAAAKRRDRHTNSRIAELQPSRISAKTARIRAQIKQRRESIARNRDLSTGTLVGGSAIKNGGDRTRSEAPHRDRVVLLVRDAYWLQASWEITRASVQRAQSSMSGRWHTATPTLRLLAVGDVASNRAERVERDITIHGGVNTWYIDVDEPPARFRVLIGYLADNGEFHSLCRSNIVETPRPGECERLDEHWNDIAEDYERIYALSGGYDQADSDLREMFEDRLQRSMPSRNDPGRHVNDSALLREAKLKFDVDAEMIIFGSTNPTASVTVGGRPVKLQGDGSFTVRLEMPDKRQVIPVTAESRDGVRQRTTVIAIERNTKAMETVELDDKI